MCYTRDAQRQKTQGNENLISVGKAVHVYLRSTTDDIILFYSHNNMYVTAPIRWAFDNLLYGRIASSWLFGAGLWGDSTYPVLFLGIPIVLVRGAVSLLDLLRHKDDRAGPLLAMWTTCVFISGVYCMADLLENNRYRYEIDPLLLTLAVFVAWEAYRHLKRAPAEAPLRKRSS